MFSIFHFYRRKSRKVSWKTSERTRKTRKPWQIARKCTIFEYRNTNSRPWFSSPRTNFIESWWFSLKARRTDSKFTLKFWIFKQFLTEIKLNSENSLKICLFLLLAEFSLHVNQSATWPHGRVLESDKEYREIRFTRQSFFFQAIFLIFIPILHFFFWIYVNFPWKSNIFCDFEVESSKMKLERIKKTI